LGLPLPAGALTGLAYRDRKLGSLLPCVRFRRAEDNREGRELPGLIRFALMAQSFPEVDYPADGLETASDGSEMAARWQEPSPETGSTAEMGNQQKLPIGEMQPDPEPPSEPRNLPTAGKSEVPVSAISSVSRKGSRHLAAISDRSFPVSDSASPPPVGTPITVDGEPGWLLPGALPKGNAPTVKVTCVAPDGTTRLVERRRIALGRAA
ncbi:MAG: hypothetical protein VKM34_02905, partial [Cyanobacteriota bacterium]|nr:hypothetical protein [Cyanobacteriota bacterium]